MNQLFLFNFQYCVREQNAEALRLTGIEVTISITPGSQFTLMVKVLEKQSSTVVELKKIKEVEMQLRNWDTLLNLLTICYDSYACLCQGSLQP